MWFCCVSSSFYLVERFIDRSKSWLFVVVENSPVPVENEDTFMLSFFAVAAIDAVVWTVVPLAGEHMEAFCGTQSNGAQLNWMKD